MRLRRILAMAFVVVFLAAAAVRAQDVTLSVAVSLKDATEELGRGFMAAHPAPARRPPDERPPGPVTRDRARSWIRGAACADAPER